MKQPCRDCPFRANSPLAYDWDASLALSDGYEPSCHSVVGLGTIFENPHPDDSVRCIGYDQWNSGTSGFRTPTTTP